MQFGSLIPTTSAFMLLGYLCGSVSSAVIICRALGLPDPRTSGSQNPGTTNVLRLGGKFAAALTLLFDVLKGFVPVVFAKSLGVEHQWLAWVALAAILGHLFPVFFKFKGGKGVATLLGVLFGLSWILGALVVGTWLLVAAIFRYSSLAALIATLAAPFYAYIISDKTYTIPLIFIAIMVILRHHANIKRLLSGKEPRIGQKKESS